MILFSIVMKLFAAVGELFDTPDVVGVTLSVRTRDDNLSIWNKTSNSDVKIMIGYFSFFMFACVSL